MNTQEQLEHVIQALLEITELRVRTNLNDEPMPRDAFILAGRIASDALEAVEYPGPNLTLGEEMALMAGMVAELKGTEAESDCIFGKPLHSPMAEAPYPTNTQAAMRDWNYLDDLEQDKREGEVMR